MSPAILSASSTDDEAIIVFEGATLSVRRAKKRHGRSSTWVASLRVDGEMDRGAQARTRDAAAGEAVRMWWQWVSSRGI